VAVTANQILPVAFSISFHAMRRSKLGNEPLDRESKLFEGSKLLPKLEESLESNEEGRAVVVMYPI
jgi:hypothetical protein